jgi:hypothetical protein
MPLTGISKGPTGGFGPFDVMRRGAVEEEEKTARAERNPLHIAMAETVGLNEPLCSRSQG